MGATAGNDSHVEFVPIHAMFDIVSGETSRSRETVLGAIHRRTGEHVGIRRPALEFSTGLEALRRTIALDHQNVLRVKTVLRDKEGVYFVTEWAEGGSLARRLGDAPLESEQLAPALLHVARGLDYLHRAGAAPVDLGLDQILEDASGVFKLGGFGLHEQNEEASGEETSVPGGGGTGAFARRVREDLRSFGRTMLRLAGGAERLPAPLKPIADRCLAEDQEQAFPDAARLVAALEKVTSGGSTSGASSRSGGERSRGVGQGVFPWLRTTDLYLEQGEAMRGGMGSVRMAIERATGRRVAIKRLLPDASRDAEGLQRFLREASSIANLDHPHILKLLQPGRDEHGDYLVLEWAAGGSLREKLERDGPLPVDEVVEVARKIGRALAFAHSKGVIHRDVKPHNILLTETGEPKLADFGLARAVGDHTLSSSHAGGGSPLYMPPEQHDRSRQADERSDLYSLGKTLYHLVTGLSPSSPQAKNLPPRLRRAVMRCLEEDPAKRPASAQAFLKELEPTPSSLRLAVPLALVFLVAAALAWRARETEDAAPSVEPRVSKPTVSTALPAVVLAGFFGADDEPLAGGAETSSEVVEVRLDLRNVSPEERERLKVEVLRGGEALDEGAFTSTWEDESRLVLSVPIEGRTNRLQVKVPDFGFASEVLELTRAEPLPTVVAVRDAERQAGESARYLTGRREVGVTVEVARAGGIDRLWIGRGSERQEVPLAGTGAERAIDPDVRLEEGENAFRWYWPTPEEPLGTGAFAIVGDFTPPVVSLREPRSGALTNRDALAIRGRVEDAHVGEEVVWRLSRDGEELASGRPHAESNGAFEDELSLVEAGEGTFVLDVVAHDRAGNASQPVGVTLTVDRTAPELVPGDGLSFRPVFDASLRLAAVDLEGHADEELSAAEVDGRPATLLPGGRFEAKGLPARDGPAAYRVSLVDRAGNVSRDFTAGHGIDVTSPTASLEFFERDGIAFLRVTPSEPLASLSVGGRSTSASGSGPLEASTGRRLDELVTWKDAPGPTRSPVEVELVDAAGNRTAYAVVVCPSDRRSAVRCKTGAGGDVVGTERCAVCGGEYCPRTGDRGRKVREDGEVHGHPVVKDAATGAWVEVDHWMLDPQCRYCGFFRAP